MPKKLYRNWYYLFELHPLFIRFTIVKLPIGKKGVLKNKKIFVLINYAFGITRAVNKFAAIDFIWNFTLCDKLKEGEEFNSLINIQKTIYASVFYIHLKSENFKLKDRIFSKIARFSYRHL